MDASQFSGGDEKKRKRISNSNRMWGRLVGGVGGGGVYTCTQVPLQTLEFILTRSISMLFDNMWIPPFLQASEAGWTPFDKRGMPTYTIQMSVLKVKLA